MPDEFLPDEIELNFEKSSLHKLYASGSGGEINPERWDRVRTAILFEDVVSDLTGVNSNPIRCPFHGTDRTPSFFLYKGSNDGWCFGCPPKEQYYDQIRFVSRYLDISRGAALRWLEKKWELPPLANITPEEDEEYVVHLRFEDLQEPFILKAGQKVQEFKDVELAEDYLSYYFKAVQAMKYADESKKIGEGQDAAEFETQAANTLANLLGRVELDRIFTRRQKSNSQ